MLPLVKLVYKEVLCIASQNLMWVYKYLRRLSFFLKMLFTCSRERVHAHKCTGAGGGTEEREGENLNQTLHWVQSPMGLHLTTLQSSPELKSRVRHNLQSHPGALNKIFKNHLIRSQIQFDSFALGSGTSKIRSVTKLGLRLISLKQWKEGRN